MLIFVGLGLSMKHLNIEAIEALRSADKIIVDSYTNIVPDFSVSELKKIIGGDREIILAKRRDLEGESIRRIIIEAKEKNIAILVPGDPFIATTHDAIRLEALEKGVPVKTVHNVSIYSVAPSAVGLQAYRFGKTVTLVYPTYFKPYSTIETIYDNLSRNLHTLLLLDLKLEENIAMTIPEAVEIILDLDQRGILGKTLAVGIAQAGTNNQYLKADRLANLVNYEYPRPPHSIVIVAKPHPIELDMLYRNAGLPENLYKEYSLKKEYP